MRNGNKGDLTILVDPITQTKQYVSPDNLLIQVGKEKKKLSVVLSEYEKNITDLSIKYTKLNEEFLNLKSKYIQNQSEQLESLNIFTKKIEALENEVNALLSVNK